MAQKKHRTGVFMSYSHRDSTRPERAARPEDGVIGERLGVEVA